MSLPSAPGPAPLPPEEIAPGIYCIDTALYRPGLAAAYLVRSGDRLAFVDTGTSRALPVLLATVAALGLSPEHVDYVIPTHVHLDHGGGTGDLMAACPNARCIVHPKGAPHLLDPSRLIAGATAVYGPEAFAQDFGTVTPVAPERLTEAADGLEVDLAGRTLVFLDTPGHANHHGCLFDAQSRGCFTGDTFGIAYGEFRTQRGPWLFAPTTPVAFDPDAWEASVDRLMGLGAERMYLTHFGAVPADRELADMLRRSIRDLAALALAEEGLDDPERQARLESAVGAHLKARAREHGVALGEAELDRLFSVDRVLNAQGLEVWLKRRAKRAAEG